MLAGAQGHGCSYIEHSIELVATIELIHKLLEKFSQVLRTNAVKGSAQRALEIGDQNMYFGQPFARMVGGTLGLCWGSLVCPVKAGCASLGTVEWSLNTVS